ncbi:MAG: hypothetical protein ABI780_14355, partial [Ardenticatenales bacterium]
DPAQPGCWRRAKRTAFGCLGLVGCGLLAAGIVAARRPMGRYALGAGLISIGLPGPSLSLAQGLIDDYPDQNAAFYLLKSAAQRTLGHLDESFVTLDEAVQKFPNTFAANDDRCLYGALFGDPKAALPYCDKAVTLIGSRQANAALAHRGMARALAGDRDGAMADLDEAVASWRAQGIRDAQFARPYGVMLDALHEGRDPLDAAALQRERDRY